jgi:Protein of unknown function (DUF2934)
MAKPRFPKSTSDIKATVSSTNGLPSLSDIRSETSVGLAEIPPASAAPETNTPESKKTETRKPARKPEIVKTEGRANLVPINVEDEIRRLAYLLAERRGFEPGHEAEDWLAAEREIRQRYRQQSA